MELKDRLKMARKSASLTQAELAQRVGIKQASISEIERGLTRSSGHLIKIAQACGVDPIWLSEGAGSINGFASSLKKQARSTESNAELLGDLVIWEEGDPLDDDDCEVPYYAEVEFAGGNGMTEVIEVAERKLRFSNSTLRAAGVECQNAACARIKGKSMERLILDGAAIGFDRACTSIIDGEIYAFNQDGMLRVKYLYRLPGSLIRIRSENSEEYPDEMMTFDQYYQDVRMLGRVFWWSTVRRVPRR